ncbi:MAG: hypothetical protein WBQ10_05615 [Terriglobales bacterium]
MDANTKRVHYYHADASALGGHIRRPFDKAIPVQAAVSLPPVGGYLEARGRQDPKDSDVNSIVSFEAAYSHVSGSVSKKNGAAVTTMVTSTVEKFNVLDTFTADRMVAQISLDHPPDGYIPRVSLIGTQFENVRIGGDRVEIILDLDMCRHSQGEYPSRRCMGDPQFLAKVGKQYDLINDPGSMPDWIKDKTVPDWVRARYKKKDVSEPALSEKGYVLCSIVKEIRGKFPGKHYHNIIEIPEFGKIFLGELVVDYGSFQLIMARLELGSPTEACISAAVGKANGTGGGGGG